MRISDWSSDVCSADLVDQSSGGMKEPFDERRYQAAILESLGRQALCDGRRDGRARTSYPDERPARQGCARCLLVLHRDRQPIGGRRTGDGEIRGQGPWVVGSTETPVGKQRASKCRARWSQYHKTKKTPKR